MDDNGEDLGVQDHVSQSSSEEDVLEGVSDLFVTETNDLMEKSSERAAVTSEIKYHGRSQSYKNVAADSKTDVKETHAATVGSQQSNDEDKHKIINLEEKRENSEKEEENEEQKGKDETSNANKTIDLKSVEKEDAEFYDKYEAFVKEYDQDRVDFLERERVNEKEHERKNRMLLKHKMDPFQKEYQLLESDYDFLQKQFHSLQSYMVTLEKTIVFSSDNTKIAKKETSEAEYNLWLAERELAIMYRRKHKMEMKRYEQSR